MPSPHPILALRDKLEKARVQAVETLAATTAPSQSDLDDLVRTQAALTAVRETIEEHGTRLGWTGDEEALEQAAVDLIKKS